MKSLKQDIKKAERIEEITGILFKQELGLILDKLNLMKHLPVHKRFQAKKHEKPKPERVRKTFEELGTVFIKFGQILSERPDVMPKEYCEELSKLQDSAPAFNSSKAKEIVNEEVGIDNFKEFKEAPLASASIAQVHKAKLKTGEEVVVKIRRPDIKEKVERDLDIINYLAARADNHIGIGNNFIEREAKEFSRWTKEELDLNKERRNIESFRKNMENEKRIRVPETFSEYSNEKVLTMEYISAVKCNDIEKIRKMNIDEKEIAKTGIRCIIKQILRDGLLHADPHPSNFMVDKKGDFVFLDFGMMTRITEKTQRELGMLMLAIAEEDIDGVVETIKRISEVEDDAEIEKFRSEIEEEILRLRDTTIQEQSISKVLIKMSTRAARNGIYLPTKITLIGKGLLTMEGIGLKIYPDFQLQNEFKDEVEKQLIKQNKPQDMMKDFGFNLLQHQEIISKLPEKISKSLDEDSEKETEINIEMKRENLLPSLLVASSTILMAASIMENILLYFGFFQLTLGILLYLKTS